MALNIVVCVKNTPSSLSVELDPSGQPKTAGVLYAINPFDEYAVEEAVRIKEKNPGSTVTALALGPDADQSVLRETISRGCDAGVLVTGAEIAGGDTLATSRVLAAAIRKLAAAQPIHLVLFGKSTNDSGAGSVGGQVAAWLDWPGVLSVKKIESIDDQAALLWRMMEDGIDKVKVGLPAAVCTVKEINEPRIPSLKGKMAAKKAVFTKWTASDLGLKPEEAGAPGSGARVARYTAPAKRGTGLRIAGGSAAQSAAQLVDTLIERKLI